MIASLGRKEKIRDNIAFFILLIVVVCDFFKEAC